MGVKFIKVDDLFRRPSQLYEALFEGVILILLYFRNRGLLKKPGFILDYF